MNRVSGCRYWCETTPLQQKRSLTHACFVFPVWLNTGDLWIKADVKDTPKKQTIFAFIYLIGNDTMSLNFTLAIMWWQRQSPWCSWEAADGWSQTQVDKRLIKVKGIIAWPFEKKRGVGPKTLKTLQKNCPTNPSCKRWNIQTEPPTECLFGCGATTAALL